MHRVLGIACALALSGCSLLFDAAEEEDVPLTRELVSTIGADQDFATLAEWMALRGGALPNRQAVRVRTLGAKPGIEHVLTGPSCSGVVRPVTSREAATQLLILDLASVSEDCAEGDVLTGSGDVRLEVIEAQPRGVSETLVFVGSPVLGPLVTDSDVLETSEEFALTLRADVPHGGVAGAGIEILNSVGAADHAMVVGTDHTLVEGFEIHSWIQREATDPFAGLRITGNFVTASKLLVHHEAGHVDAKSDGIVVAPNAYGASINNCMLYDLGRAGIHDFWSSQEESPEPTRVANCSLRRCAMNFDGGSNRYGCVGREDSPIRVQNTVALIEGGTGLAFADNFSKESSNNAADDGTARGLPAFRAESGNFSDERDLHLSATPGALGGCGRVVAEIADDIDGEARPASGWSIGADQLSATIDCEDSTD